MRPWRTSSLFRLRCCPIRIATVPSIRSASPIRDPREIAIPTTVVVGPDGAEVWRRMSFDFAERPEEDEALAVVGPSASSRRRPSRSPCNPVAGPKAMPFESLTAYYRGAKFAAIAMGRRYPEAKDERKSVRGTDGSLHRAVHQSGSAVLVGSPRGAPVGEREPRATLAAAGLPQLMARAYGPAGRVPSDRDYSALLPKVDDVPNFDLSKKKGVDVTSLRHRKKLRTRAEILAAAANLFAEEGSWQGTTMDEHRPRSGGLGSDALQLLRLQDGAARRDLRDRSWAHARCGSRSAGCRWR